MHGNWAHRTILRLGLIGRCQGQAVVANHFFEASTLKEADFLSDALRQQWGSDVAADWVANLLNNWRFIHTSDYFLDRVDAQIMEVGGQFEHRLLATTNTNGMPAAGLNEVVADDLATAGVLRWRSVLAGKHHRGRTYVGPLGDVSVNAGIITDVGPALFSSRLAAYGAAMIARYTGLTPQLGANFVIYSRPYSTPDGAYTRRIGGVLTVVNNGPTANYDGDSTFITTSAVDSAAREQRRREIGVGA